MVSNYVIKENIESSDINLKKEKKRKENTQTRVLALDKKLACNNHYQKFSTLAIDDIICYP